MARIPQEEWDRVHMRELNKRLFAARFEAFFGRCIYVLSVLILLWIAAQIARPYLPVIVKEIRHG